MATSKKYRFEIISKKLGRYAVYAKISGDLLGYIEKSGSGEQWVTFLPNQEPWEGAYYDDQETAGDKLAAVAWLAAVQADWAKIEEYGSKEHGARWHAMMAAAENADLTMQEEGGTYGDRSSARWYEVAIASFTPVSEEPEPEKIKVALIVVNGTERVHGADCRDVKTEATKFRYEPYYVSVATREELEEDWWGDVASDNADYGTPEWYEAIRMNSVGMVYLPCCKLPEAAVATAPEGFTSLSVPSMVVSDSNTRPEEIKMGKKMDAQTGYYSKSGVAHTALCATMKAAERGSLNFPIMEECYVPLAEMLERIASTDPKTRWRECGLCKTQRRMAAERAPKETEVTAELEGKTISREGIAWVVTTATETEAGWTLKLKNAEDGKAKTIKVKADAKVLVHP